MQFFSIAAHVYICMKHTARHTPKDVYSKSKVIYIDKQIIFIYHLFTYFYFILD